MKTHLVWILGAAAMVAACGGSGDTTGTPTAPASAATANADGGGGGSKTTGTTTASSAGATGTISSLAGACPALSFKLDGKVIKTDSTTRFADVKCADLKDGVRVGVSGTAQSDGSILAKIVKPMAPPPPAPTMTEGTVSALSGACPAITFTVAGKTFTTDAQTRFGNGGCAAVKNDVKVVVQSQATAAGGVRVLAVKLILPPPPAPNLAGEVTAVSGTCPAITISLGSKTAVTSAATVFTGKTCADVKPGVKVAIFGTVAPGSATITATKVVVR
jgi:hypothetical protein